MKSFIWHFVRNESGVLSFEDGLTVVSLTIGVIAVLALMNSTAVQLYAELVRMLPGLR